MRKILAIAGNSLLRTARDRKGLAMLILMPMILIGILGFALAGMMGQGTITPFDVLVVVADEPALPPVPPGTPDAAVAQLPTVHLGRELAEQVFQIDQVKRVITAKTVTDLAQAKADVAAGKAVAAVYVPASFSADVLAGRKAAVKLFTDPGRPTQASIVSQVVQIFTEGVAGGQVSAQLMSPRELEQVMKNPQSLAARSPGAMPAVREVPSGAREVSGMQYYAAAMCVMFMVMTGFGRGKALLEERQDGTLGRLLTTPTRRPALLAGQILGTVAVLVAQFLILMAGTSLLFGVYWGPLVPALSIGIATAIAASGLGIAAAGLMNDPKAADAAMGIVGNLFAMLSGGMFPLYLFPDGMKLAAKAIPNYWALQGFLDQMAGVGAGQHLWLPVAVLASIGMATGMLGTWRLAAR